MPFTSIAEFEATESPTPAETELIEACRAGAPCILGDGSLPPEGEPCPERHIRAPLLRLLILGTPESGLHPKGVMISGGHVTGQLDLSFARARGRCALDTCRFDEEPQFAQTELAQLSLQGSRLPGLYGQGIKVKGSLFLRRLKSKGTIALSGARIGSQLDCEDGEFDGGRNRDGVQQSALIVQSVEIGASLLLVNLSSIGTIEVNGSRVGGQFACIGASLVGGLDRDNTQRSSLIAQSVVVGASLILRDLSAIGPVDLAGAQIGGQIDCSGATFDGGQDKKGVQQEAFNAQSVQIGADLLLRDTTAKGTIDLDGTRIGGKFSCEGAQFDAGHHNDRSLQTALGAQRLRVTQGFFFRQVKSVRGQIYLDAAHVGDLADDTASWPSGTDAIYLNGFSYDRVGGSSPLTLASRKGWLERGSQLDGRFFPQPYTQFAKVLREMGHGAEARKVLMEAQEQAAKHQRMLNRKTYGVAGALRKFSRKPTKPNGEAIYDALTESPTPLHSVWETILQKFRLLHSLQVSLPNGPPPLSETTMALARQDFRNQMFWVATKARLRIGWSWFKDAALRWVIGYGHAPQRAILAMLCFILPFAVLFHCAYSAGGMVPNSDVVLTSPSWYWAMLFESTTPTLAWDKGATAKHYETFYALAYAFDVFVPIVDLGQQSAWSGTTVSWWGWTARMATMFLEVIGWIITALAAASITGLVQKNQPD